MGSGRPGDSTGPHNSNPQIRVDLIQRSERWAEARIDEVQLHKAILAAFRASRDAACGASGGPFKYELALVLSDDAEVRQLNRVWRHSDKPTNVLAFPAAPNAPGKRHNGMRDACDDAEDTMLGDVVLAFETVSSEAQAFGLSLTQHTSHLAVHGLLHLTGYDHESAESAAEMEELETRILAALGLHDPYAAGSSESGLIT